MQEVPGSNPGSPTKTLKDLLPRSEHGQPWLNQVRLLGILKMLSIQHGVSHALKATRDSSNTIIHELPVAFGPPDASPTCETQFS